MGGFQHGRALQARPGPHPIRPLPEQSHLIRTPSLRINSPRCSRIVKAAFGWERGRWRRSLHQKSAPVPSLRARTGNPNSLEKDSVTAVLQDSRGVLWIGCIRSLVKVDPHTGKFEFFRSHGIPRAGRDRPPRASLRSPRIGRVICGSGPKATVSTGSIAERADFRCFGTQENNPASLSSDTVVSLAYRSHRCPLGGNR